MRGDGGCFAPTVDHGDSMHVIGHDNEGVQFNRREMIRDFLPTTPGDFAGIVQPHFTVHHMTEQTFPIPRADRHEIGARLAMVGARRAVPVHEADGTAMVSVWRVSHYWSLASRYDSSCPKETGLHLRGLRLPASMPSRCPRCCAPCFAWAQGVAAPRFWPPSDRRGSRGP